MKWFRPWAFLAAKYEEDIEVWLVYYPHDGVTDTWNLLGRYLGSNPPKNIQSVVDTHIAKAELNLSADIQAIKEATTQSKGELVTDFYATEPRISIKTEAEPIEEAKTIPIYVKPVKGATKASQTILRK